MKQTPTSQNGLLLPERTSPQLDEEIFEGLTAIQRDLKETYNALKVGERSDEIVAAWHEGQDGDLRAVHIDEDEIKTKLTALHQWKQELLGRDDIDPMVQQLYRWKVNEDIANLHMLEASAKGDMRNFQRWNEYIYGKPDEATYRGALDWVAHEADLLLAGDQPVAVIEAATKVKELLADERGYRELLIPESEVYQMVREDHFRPAGYYGLLLAGVELPLEGKISREVGDPILLHILRNNLKSTKELADSEDATWSVSHKDNVVRRPREYNLPVKRFIGLPVGHETGSHDLEYVNGSRSPIALASIGLDRTELGNEGRAVIREQVPYETFDEFGKLVRWRDILRRHIAISFAMGTGEDAPHSSSEVYEFMNAIDMMYQAKLTPDDPEAIKEKAHAKTDSLLLRVLKGTDGGGGAYLKDKVYLEGHVACWLTAATKGSEAISQGDLGKFDINNPRHIVALQELGLLPKEQ